MRFLLSMMVVERQQGLPRPGLGARTATWRQAILAAAALGLALVHPAQAVDVSGSLRAWIGATDSTGFSSDEEDGTFRLALSQELTPWLTLFGSFRANRFRASFPDLPELERTSEQPEIGLSYDRTHLNARLLFSDRAIRTTDESQNLDIQTLLSTLEWSPTRGPRLGFRFQNSTSTADAALFGRDTESRNLNLRADYARTTWNARYSFNLSEVDNNRTGLSLEEARHEIRAGYFENLWADRWSFALDARYAEVDQTQDAPSGATLGLSVPIAQGLFAIDPTPALGTLEPAAALIDGDTTTPAAPGIELGGANTFRNIGVDLGVNRPVSELEVTVDAPSGPIVWEVWESPDNSSWFRVDGAVSSFDAGFLRYNIRFPQRTNRFFKAVNVSVNAVPEAAVTEVRALLAAAQSERAERSGSEYWVNLQSSLRATERVELLVAASVRRDQDLVATDLRRSYDETGLSAQVNTDIHDTLQLRLGYRVSELDETLGPIVKRREELSTAALDWRPLDTLDVLVTAQQREESDGSQVLVTTDSLTLQAVAQIFPELVLNSTLGTADTVNALFGFSQDTRYVIESLEARPNDRWLLAGSLARYEYDSEGNLVVSSRTTARLRVAWFATPFLSLNTEQVQSEDDLGDTSTQRLGMQWSPGPKLSLSASYFETDASAGTGTANLTFDGSYKLNRWLQLWVALNEAESSINSQQPLKTEALRFGLNAVF